MIIIGQKVRAKYAILYGVVREGFLVKGIIVQRSTETEEKTMSEHGEEFANQSTEYSKGLR